IIKIKVNMVKEYVIYKGIEYQIEWYYNNNGKSQALTYYERLTFNRKSRIFTLIKLMGDSGFINNREKFCHEGNQIYAFKAFQDRFFCFFFYGSKIIITNAYLKKHQKLLISAKQKALNARENYILRVNLGKYYGK